MNALDFAAFYTAVHGKPPFPWQAALCDQLLETHQWPDLIDLPTASGKTACLDIALFHLAQCALQGEPWRASRRIVFMVDRRIIVDAAYDRAERLRSALTSSNEPAVKCVADALLKAGGQTSLLVQRLRGGMPRERGFALDPAQPMIITSTIDQIGSRLLFRGYGMKPYSWSLHAGLLGHDTLLLLDEAHLSTPFIALVEGIRREQSRAQRTLPNIQPVRVIPLSATIEARGLPFRLTEKDHANPTLARRRMTPKPARLIRFEGKPAERPKLLAQQAREIFQSLKTQSPSTSPAVAVIVNRVRTARAVFETLREELSEQGIEIQLMIGRGRPLDRDQLSKRLLTRAAAGRETPDREPGLIVVATQTIEVGADLDFQGLISECASLDALRQRFGRLDRLGNFGHAQAAIIGGGESVDDPVYGPSLLATWTMLNELATPNEVSPNTPTINFGIAALDALLQPIDTNSLRPAPRELMPLSPAYVQLLSQTAPAPPESPDVAALLHGHSNNEEDVQIIWREHLPLTPTGELDANEEQLVDQLLDALPPSSLEALSLPPATARAWLNRGKDSTDLTDLEATRSNDTGAATPHHKVRSAWRRTRSLDDNKPGWELISDLWRLRPGDTLVVHCSYGGCDEFGYAPEDTTPVVDQCWRAREQLNRTRIVPIAKETYCYLTPLDESQTAGIWQRLVEVADSDQYSGEEQLLSVLLEPTPTEAESSPLQKLLTNELSLEVLRKKDGHLYAILAHLTSSGDAELSDEDLSSSQTQRITLKMHSEGVGKRARQLAQAVGLSNFTELLGRAGDLHDLGKADPRFQRMLKGNRDDSEILAKSATLAKHQRNEPSERHEAYSVAIIDQHPELLKDQSEPELIRYLVGSHHGRGRALMPDWQDEGTQIQLTFENQPLQYKGIPKLGALQSEWPKQFWALDQRYGPWGLAYLEALLRLADHLQSRAEQTSEQKGK